MTAKKKRYAGALGTPSLPPPERVGPARQMLLGDQAADLIKAAEARNLETFIQHHGRGIKLLLEHYGINPADHGEGSEYQALALLLAIDHVPFFQPRQSKRGPKGKDERACLLEVDIALRQLAGDKTEAAALKHLVANQSPWNRKGKSRDADPVADLARRRREHVQDPVVRQVRQIMEFAREKGARVVLEDLRRNIVASNSALR